jgi:hypothetical protein
MSNAFSFLKARILLGSGTTGAITISLHLLSVETVLRRVAALLPVAVFLAVYLPRAGHGFILDDFWLLESRIATVSDVVALFTHNNGFYRRQSSLKTPMLLPPTRLSSEKAEGRFVRINAAVFMNC